MREAHRIRNGLNEWNRQPAEYVELPQNEPVKAGDVQRINDEWFVEYPANGFLVGKTPGAGGRWFRMPTETDTNSGKTGGISESSACQISG